MFLNIPSAIAYTDPWLEDYDARLRQLTTQPRRIAYFYEYPDSSTFRYRVFNPSVTLTANPESGTSGAWFDNRDLDADDCFVDQADALVICRARYTSAIARMVARARTRRIPIVFDCDDLVFDIGRVHLLVDSLNGNQRDETVWDFWFASVSRIAATLGLCDSVIATNEYLAGCAQEYDSRLCTAVVPNYLNREQQRLSQTFYQAKRESRWQRDGRIHIGYFSGSPTHARDFAVAEPAIIKTMETDPRIVLRLVGFLEPTEALARYRDRIEVYPLQDFLNLQRLISEVEINIAPLQQNSFSNSKSELKFFEAAICGTLTLATPTFSFRNNISHRETGLLVPSYNWDQALQEAVAIVEDRSRYEAIAEAASEQVKRAYGWDRHATNILQAVFNSGSPGQFVKTATVQT